MGEGINRNLDQKPVEGNSLQKIRDLLNRAKAEKGIEWEEGPDEFVIKFDKIEKASPEPGPNFEREVHVPKRKEIDLVGSEEKKSAKLVEMIEAFLENPEAGENGEITKTIAEIDKNKD